MKRRGRKLHSFLRGRFHGCGIVVTGRTLRARHQRERRGSLMLLMARGTRTILHHVRFVEGVHLPAQFKMAGIASFIDELDPVGRDPIAETVAHNLPELLGGQLAAGDERLVMTIVAVVRQRSVIGGKQAWVKKLFRRAFVGKPDRGQAADKENQTNNQSGAAPSVQFSVIAEIAFVALGDLLLRASRAGHGLSSKTASQMHARRSA